MKHQSLLSIVISLSLASSVQSAQMISADPSHYEPVSSELLTGQFRILHSNPPTLDELQLQSAAVHGATIVPSAAPPVINTGPDAIPSAADLISPPPTPLTFERDGLSQPILIHTDGSDPTVRFNYREVRQIQWVLNSVPVDFLKGITSIEPQRYTEATSTIKLAEWQGSKIIVYAPPMVKDTLPYAILLHYQNN